MNLPWLGMLYGMRKIGDFGDVYHISESTPQPLHTIYEFESFSKAALWSPFLNLFTLSSCKWLEAAPTEK